MFELTYRFAPTQAAPHKLPRASEQARRLLVQGNRDFAEMTDAHHAGKKTRVIPFDPQALGWGVGDGSVPAHAALLEGAVVLNAAWSAYCLRQEFQTQFAELGVVFGAYDLVTRQVRLPLSPPGELTEEGKDYSLPLKT